MKKQVGMEAGTTTNYLCIYLLGKKKYLFNGAETKKGPPIMDVFSV